MREMSDDRILLQGLGFYGYHGVIAEENRLGQRFVVDVEMTVDTSVAGANDDITKTIDYGAVFRCIRTIVEGPPFKLVETVAERIAARILDGYAVDAVMVRVRKPDVPIPGSIEFVGVEIRRRRAPR